VGTQYAVRLFVRVSGADHNQPGIWHLPFKLAVGFKQIPQSFALLQAAHKQDVQLAVLVLGQGSDIG
jgi:hypothetical protein